MVKRVKGKKNSSVPKTMDHKMWTILTAGVLLVIVLFLVFYSPDDAAVAGQATTFASDEVCGFDDWDVDDEYLLDVDLTTTGNCFVIDEPIKLDCQGHSIIGNGAWTGIAIVSDGVELFNCQVAGFETGLLIDGVTGGAVALNSFVDNENGILIRDSSGVRVEGNRFNGNTESGIKVDNSETVVILGNTVFDNDVGVNLLGGDQVYLNKNIICSNDLVDVACDPTSSIIGDDSYLDSTSCVQDLSDHGDCEDAQYVALYDNNNLGGRMIILTEDIPDLSDYLKGSGGETWQDAASSVLVSGGAVVELFDNKNYRGDSVITAENINKLGDHSLNNKMSSLQFTTLCPDVQLLTIPSSAIDGEIESLRDMRGFICVSADGCSYENYDRDDPATHDEDICLGIPNDCPSLASYGSNWGSIDKRNFCESGPGCEYDSITNDCKPIGGAFDLGGLYDNIVIDGTFITGVILGDGLGDDSVLLCPQPASAVGAFDADEIAACADAGCVYSCAGISNEDGCVSGASCERPTTEICDGADTDGDGDVDRTGDVDVCTTWDHCGDFATACGEHQLCGLLTGGEYVCNAVTGAVQCSDGSDNDNDGLIDGADPDCGGGDSDGDTDQDGIPDADEIAACIGISGAVHDKGCWVADADADGCVGPNDLNTLLVSVQNLYTEDTCPATAKKKSFRKGDLNRDGCVDTDELNRLFVSVRDHYDEDCGGATT